MAKTNRARALDILLANSRSIEWIGNNERITVSVIPIQISIAKALDKAEKRGVRKERKRVNWAYMHYWKCEKCNHFNVDGLVNCSQCNEPREVKPTFDTEKVKELISSHALSCWWKGRYLARPWDDVKEEGWYVDLLTELGIENK